MSKLFKGLKEGLQDAIAHKKGKLELRSKSIDLPKAPAPYKKRQIKKLRISLSYSQSIFAKILNVSIKTVQSWESGERSPTSSALRLLELIEKGIYRPEIHIKR